MIRPDPKTPSTPHDQILDAMEPYVGSLRALWGAEFDPLVEYVAATTTPWRTNTSILVEIAAQARPPRTLIVV